MAKRELKRYVGIGEEISAVFKPETAMKKYLVRK